MGVEKESLNPLSNGRFDIINMPVYNYYNNLCSSLRRGGEKREKREIRERRKCVCREGWSKLRLLND